MGRRVSLSCVKFLLTSRRKAEEDRIRKEEEKARRELIKQEYLRRKQQALMEEQGLVKPRPRTKSRRSRPKSLHREESNSLSKGSTTRKQTCGTQTAHISVKCSMLSLSRLLVLVYFHFSVFVVILCVCVHVCYAGNSLKKSMLIKAQSSAAGCRGGEPSNLLCMMRY